MPSDWSEVGLGGLLVAAAADLAHGALMVGSADFRARVVVPLIAAMTMLMDATDATVLATALPVLAHDLSVPVLSLKLALSTYLVAFAAMVPVSGWLADRFGARRVFVASIVVFLIGSAFCAMQSTLPGLIIFRAVQGAGGAMMVPVGRLIVLRGVPKSEMVQALAWVTVPALMGPALGPVVGALVTETLGWRWIFLINLPIGVLAIGLALWLVPRMSPSPVEPLDGPGFVLSALGLGAGLFGLSCLGEHLVSTSVAVASMAAGTAMMVIYLWRARGRTDVLLDPRLFRHHTLSVGIVSGTLFRMSGGAAAFLLPLLFQVGLGLSILASGMLSGLFALGGLTMRALAPRILDRFGFRRSLILGTLVSAVTFIGMGLIQGVNYALIVPLLILAGFAQALVFTGISSLVFVDATEEEMGRATGMAAVSQQVGLTAGISVAALVLRANGGLTTDTPQLTHFPMAFWATSAVLIVAALSLLRLRAGEAHALHHSPERVLLRRAPS